MNDYKKLKDGMPCGHKGCLHHLSHACEGCGRIGGVRGIVMNEQRLAEIEEIVINDIKLYNCVTNYKDVLELIQALREERQKVVELESELDRLTTLRPIDELQTDNDVLLWYVPVEEPPIVGSCLDEHFDSYYQTHWSPLPRVKGV